MSASFTGRTAAIFLLLHCFLPLAGMSYAQSGESDGIGVRNPSLLSVMNEDTTGVEAADSAAAYLQKHFLRNSAAGPGAYLAMRADLFYGYERYRLTRVDRMMEGAQMGAKVGLLLSAVGTTAGLWDEKDSWYLVGALTALGVLLRGGVVDEDPEWRVRLKWEPDGRRGEVWPGE